MLTTLNLQHYKISLKHLPIKLSSLSSTKGLLLKVKYSSVLPTRLRLSGTVTNLLLDKSISRKFTSPLKASSGILSISVLDKSRT